MNYLIREISVLQLLEWIKVGKIELHSFFRRNFIWSTRDQKLLIDSVSKGYPLPNFFIYRNAKGGYDMVDGQQRATTICKYVKNEFPDSKKRYYKDIDQDKFMSYKLSVTEICDVDESAGESLEDFYSLVNKRGVHLNAAEVNKAQYHNAPFMVLVNELMDLQGLIELDIFSTKTVQRMNDRSLIEELVAYLFKKNVTDKRKAVEELLETDLDNESIENVKSEFKRVIDRLVFLNEIKPINSTRFKQRNDFYTWFCFLSKHKELPDEVLVAQYRFLTFIDEKGFIRPTNEDCETFKEYAYNCVTQSNSKPARQMRLTILEELLIAYEGEDDMAPRLADVCEFFEAEFDLSEVSFIHIDKWKVIDAKQFI